MRTLSDIRHQLESRERFLTYVKEKQDADAKLVIELETSIAALRWVMGEDPDKTWLICSFCLKSAREVKKLIHSPPTGAQICEECIGLCNIIVAEGDAADVESKDE